MERTKEDKGFALLRIAFDFVWIIVVLILAAGACVGQKLAVLQHR